MGKEARIGLSRFIRNECANHDRYYGGCLFQKDCLVEKSKRCQHFERAVLGPTEYDFRTTNYDWQKLFEDYGQINPDYRGRGVVVRRCKCGTPLLPGRKLCDRCNKPKKEKNMIRGLCKKCHYEMKKRDRGE